MYTYEKPYYLLFNAITDALRQLEACHSPCGHPMFSSRRNRQRRKS